MKHAGDNYTYCDWCVCNSNLRILKGLEDFEVETIQTTTLLRTARIVKRVLET